MRRDEETPCRSNAGKLMSSECRIHARGNNVEECARRPYPFSIDLGLYGRRSVSASEGVQLWPTCFIREAIVRSSRAGSGPCNTSPRPTESDDMSRPPSSSSSYSPSSSSHLVVTPISPATSLNLLALSASSSLLRIFRFVRDLQSANKSVRQALSLVDASKTNLCTSRRTYSSTTSLAILSASNRRPLCSRCRTSSHRSFNACSTARRTGNCTT